jgi:hypothetical protein
MSAPARGSEPQPLQVTKNPAHPQAPISHASKQLMV